MPDENLTNDAASDASSGANGQQGVETDSAEANAQTEATPRGGARQMNSRPDQVVDFLYQGEVWDGWLGSNRKANRFYLLNISKVMDDLEIEHTNMKRYFEQAQEVIDGETDWKDQYNFKYESSHTQIYPRKRHAPKNFGTAVTCIVAMECYADAKKAKYPDYNVYDHLRIIPATYFVDRFNPVAYEKVGTYFNGLSEEDRKPLMKGLEAKDFAELGRKYVGQVFTERLFGDMSDGHTVTKFVANRFTDLLADFPEEYRLGPVRQAGDQDAYEPGLGWKNPVPNLRVPKVRRPEQIARGE